jgi:hypothetical protein
MPTSAYQGRGFFTHHLAEVAGPCQRTTLFPGEPMLYSVAEIHAAVKRLVQEGYAALTARQQAIVDSLSAVC